MHTVVWVLLIALASNISAGPVYPVRPDPTGRYLVDSQGEPFLIQSDTPWDLITGLKSGDVILYLDDRQSKGFNTLIVELVEHKFQSASNPYLAPTNSYGQPPFLTPGDFSTTNEIYFAHADWVIEQAAARGMVVVLFPCFMGYPDGDAGWHDEMLANGTQDCQVYGEFVGNRYKDKPNIIWAMYGDHNPDGSVQPVVDALAAGIQATDTNHLITVELQRNFDVRTTLAGDDSWLQLNTLYSSPTVYPSGLTAYTQTPARPYFMIENNYEGEHDSTPASVRSQAYWANLSGACGQAYGNSPVWGFWSGWQTELDSVGANDMARLAKLFLSRPWTDLVPDADHLVLTAGYGTFGSTNYVTASLASDGATMIAYLPVGAAVTVDLTKLSGTQSQAWWYDPRDGSASSAGTFPTTGSQSFPSPTADDWVLVIDDSSRGFPSPGIVPTSTSLHVTTTALLRGVLGIPYSMQLTAGGGTPPYNWNVVSGTLPPGLTLQTNGLLAGTPTSTSSSTFTVQVTDAGIASAIQTFNLTVNSSNTPPVISSIANQFINASTMAGPLAFAIGDDETAAVNLALSGSSSNTTLVPNSNIVFGGSASHRTVTVSPNAGQSGTTTVAVSVSDGQLSASTSFLLTVNPFAPTPGLAAAYSFDEGTGTTVTDVSGNGNVGTLLGAAWTTEGKYGNALAFDGSSRVIVPDSKSLDLTNGMTLEAWLYPTVAPTGWTTVVLKEQDTQLAYSLYAGSTTDQPSTWVYIAAEEGFLGNSMLPLDTWSHLAATYDGLSLRLYVNGVQVGSQPIPGSVVNSSQNLSIGGNGIWGEYFHGRIDDVRIYGRALSAGEIQTDMTVPVGSSPRLNVQLLDSNTIRISLLGSPGTTYRIQSTTNLANVQWLDIGTATADPAGKGMFDFSVTPVSTFYRTAYP